MFLVLALAFSLIAVEGQVFCNDFCQPAKVPSFTLVNAGVARSTNTSVCCPATFSNCTSSPFCRDLVEYTLQAGGNGEEECPPTTPECQCQLSINGIMNLTICPKPQECCPTCSCIGDPHCNSFNRSIPEGDLVVCDARNDNCVNSATTCRNSMWDGQNCTWITNVKTPYCSRVPGTVQPFLQFYQKWYSPTPQAPKQQLSINLTIEAYGSIHVIDIVDGSLVLKYTVGTTRCTGPASGPYALRMINGDLKAVFSLPESKVEVDILCFPSEAAFARIDIDIRDPTLQLSLRGDDFVPTGYCATGVIPQEHLAFSSGTCLGINRELGTNIWRVCRQSTPLPTCYTNWCNQQKYWSRLEIDGVRSSQQCFNYLNTDINGWIYSSCAISPRVANGQQIVEPQDCPNNPACAKCVADCLDFPQLCASILFAPAPPPNPTCTSTTNGLLQIGLRQKALKAGEKGVMIQYSQNNGLTYTSIFALTDAQTQSCPCNPLRAQASDPQAAVLFRYGKYRVIQCTQQGNKPCDGSPGYSITIDYFNPSSNSVPFETLYSMNKLACTSDHYPNCPPNYQCCIWTTRAAWETCMVSVGLNPADYPKCF